ncbi:MAG: hypothetical protein ACFB4I_20120 [Cyanophyceae cyanobacterium]
MSSKTIPKTYSLLSIGQRGAGKTVFLAGSYTELDSAHQLDAQAVWINCRDSQTRENMEALLSYITRSGHYPPPTIKITNFNFSLKRTVNQQEQTLCHFRWWDLPGESCSYDDPDFRNLVFESNGCCIFIDADALIHQPTYHQNLQEIRQQLIPIVTLVHINQLNYAFAFLLTKCDLLETDTATAQLQEHLHPLTTELDLLDIDYKLFYLRVPIVAVERQATLQAQGTAEPLLWLMDELETFHHQNGAPSTNAVERLRTQDVVEGSLQSVVKSVSVASFPPQEAVPGNRQASAQISRDNEKSGPNLLALSVILASLAGVGLGWWLYANLSTSPSEPRPALEQ